MSCWNISQAHPFYGDCGRRIRFRTNQLLNLIAFNLIQRSVSLSQRAFSWVNQGYWLQINLVVSHLCILEGGTFLDNILKVPRLWREGIVDGGNVKGQFSWFSVDSSKMAASTGNNTYTFKGYNMKFLFHYFSTSNNNLDTGETKGRLLKKLTGITSVIVFIEIPLSYIFFNLII